ncbi:MAG: AI-2E family transporter [Elusimicrobiota bacterium]|jgi:predicted PurR-regulated permease PerM
MTTVKKLSYLAIPLLLAGSVWLGLGPVLLAGLFSFMLLQGTDRLLRLRLGPTASRWLALVIYLVVAASVFWMFVRFVQQTLSTLPQIAATAIPKIIAFVQSYGFDLPFDNAYELREVVIKEIQDNADVISKVSGIVTLRFFHILIAIFVAILCFFREPDAPRGENLYDALRTECAARVALFMASFEKVLGAQILISLVNTALTAVFLSVMGFPHVLFLVLATFILGTMPIIGNILSNTIIVGTAVTLSIRHGLFALGFLVVIHKGEYFLNSRIIGSSIKAPMWQTLLAILLGECLMGIPGIILAPALLHYAKQELRALPAK